MLVGAEPGAHQQPAFSIGGDMGMTGAVTGGEVGTYGRVRSPGGSTATDGPERFQVLRFDTEPRRRLLDELRLVGHDRPLLALSDALATSAPAATLPGVVLAVRELPDPLLVVAGTVDRAGQARLSELAGLLDEAGERLRFVGWKEVEDLCLVLAERLRALLGPELPSIRLVGVPRGGLIVGGLLAYALDLPRHRLGTGEAETLLLVDDCVLSGLRLREELATVDAERVVIATLFAHPEVGRAVEASEPRVLRFVSATDLDDHAPTMLGTGGAEAWRRRWAALVPERYGTALLDLLVFPWSEPQVRLRNPETGEVEQHWSLAPQEACFRRRVEPRVLEVQAADELPGTARLAPHVLPVRREGTMFLVDTATSRSFALRGAASSLWSTWLETGDDERTARLIGDEHGRPEGEVRSDLEGLLRRLRREGLLLSRTPSARSSR
jgi:hypothetical protein